MVQTSMTVPEKRCDILAAAGVGMAMTIIVQFAAKQMDYRLRKTVAKHSASHAAING